MPGEEVTLSAFDAQCNPRYGENARIKITVTDFGGGKVIDTTALLNDAGGFTYTFRVPPEAAAGEGSIAAFPYDIDWCDDTGRNNRADAEAPAFHTRFLRNAAGAHHDTSLGRGLKWSSQGHQDG